jgi:hypothetical protein
MPRPQPYQPPRHQRDWWNQPALVEAVKAQHVGQLVRAWREAHTPRITQETAARWLLVGQGRLSELESAKAPPVTDLGRLTHWADVIGLPADLWWFAASAPLAGDSGLYYQRDLTATLASVEALGRNDMDRRGFLRSAAFAASAAAGPSRDWLLATLDEAMNATGRVGHRQVEAIRQSFALFQDLDVFRGGGFAREKLTGFVADYVLPLLRHNGPDTASGRALWEAGAEQLYLLGWMAYDDGEHPLAQRYLIQALRCAEAAGATDLGAHVLAGLSDQATLTGDPVEGVKLAAAGRHGLVRGHSRACRADLLALQARAEAAMGEARAAATHVAASQAAFADVEAADEAPWAKFIDVAYLNGEWSNALMDAGDPANAAVFARISAKDAARQGRARRGSLARAALARVALDQPSPDVELAAAEATATVHLAMSVDSFRSRDAVTGLRARLVPYRGHRAVEDFFDVADALMPEAGPRID